MSMDSPSAISFPTLKSVAAVAAGNALAFYDFQTFGFFAVQIGHAFFPGSSSADALLLTLATFGVGFVARPLGAIVIGTIARHSTWQWRVNHDGKGSRGIKIMPLMIVAGKRYVSV
jgi:hypothetical protein